ncbi:hypothetical protein LO749_11160 [Paracoccus denitrificans]|uniref:hypothetical protein n=1 Tax=Paracoccus denitrificans TaxID=266 RepID=UPI001E61F3AE|nr:hypothetical protein [Paracoccus denitrificans]UFS64703.1 hypothetical protein LO749_11160 [Paracoccus denitrificans]
MNETATIECPFCASTLKAHAKVCAHCGARRVAGMTAKGQPLGKGGVWFIRVFLTLWLLIGLSMFAMESAPVGIGMLVLWALMFFFNRKNIFPDGQERWYRDN